MSFFENTRKPVGFGGKIMVAMMNFGHSAMAEWGLRFLHRRCERRYPLHLPQGNPDGSLRALCACDRNFIRALCGAGDVRLGS